MRLPALCLALIASAAAAQQAPPFAAFDFAGPPVLNDPHDLAFGPDGRLYVADKLGDRIAVLDPETLDVVDEIGAGRLPFVRDVSFGPDGRAVLAVTGYGAALVFDRLDAADPQPVAALGGPGTEGTLAHSNGRIYVMASAAGALIAYEGEAIVAVAQGHWGAHDIAEAPGGDIWLADNAARRLVRYSPDLERLQVLNGPEFGFLGPRYLDIDPAGRLIVADQDAHRVLLIDPDAPDGPALLGVLGDGAPGLGPGKFDDPEGVALNGARYFISDSDNNRIVRYIVVVN